MKSRIGIIALSLALLFSAGLGAVPYYDSGSQMFSINAGAVVPLSLTNFETNKTTWGPGEDGTHMSIGGIGAISYQVFLNSAFALGGEIGYQFNFAMDNEVFSSVPILLKMTFMPVQGNIDVPISFGVGFNYLSYDSYSKFTFMANMEIGARYFFNDNWGLGIHSGISFIPEPYINEKDNVNKSSILTVIPATLSVTYRH